MTEDKPTQALAPNGHFSFDDPGSFAHMQRVAKMFSASELVPSTFRGDQGMPNCVIALEMARRMNASPLAIMQQIYIVHGKPAWSSQFIIACINTCGRYSPLRFDVTGTGDKTQCVAWAYELGSNEKLCGPPASIEMSKKEGWFGKNGSKWQTMPDLMLRYRAATFFGRLYAPELLMGMKSIEEAIDVPSEVTELSPKINFSADIEQLKRAETVREVVKEVEEITPAPKPPVEDLPIPPQYSLAAVVTAEAHSFDDYRRVGIASGWFPGMDPTSWEDFNQIPTELAETHLAARKTILRKLKEGVK